MGKEVSIENKNRKVEILTIDGKMTTGFLNTLGYDRLSDCLQKDSSDFIVLYETGSYTHRTIFILKKNILAIEEVEE